MIYACDVREHHHHKYTPPTHLERWIGLYNSFLCPNFSFLLTYWQQQKQQEKKAEKRNAQAEHHRYYVE